VIRVLVVDDQHLICDAFAALVRDAPGMEVVGQADNGHDAVALAASEAPDVILMDIQIPGIDGVAATERILAEAHDPPPRVLILTIFDLDEYVYGALRAGASGFLLKEETRGERLLLAIRAVAAGDSLFAPEVTRRLVQAYAPRLPVSAQAFGCLTAREIEVIRHVATGADNATVARQFTLSEATVKTHLNRAMTKLGLKSRAQVVAFAYENGIIAPGDGSSACSP
jgi:DNA-binding NarL/FixJ family response regulator